MSEQKTDTPHNGSKAESKGCCLANLGAASEINARVQADLDRALSDKVLAYADQGAVLARDFEAAVDLSLPLPSEIDQALNRVQVRVATSEQEIEHLLSLDRVGDIAVSGMYLNQLLDRGASGAEERATLKRGLLFLKHKMYPQAAEWWTLNRPPANEKTKSRSYLLLTLLLVLTLRLAGDDSLAAAALEEADRCKNSLG